MLHCDIITFSVNCRLLKLIIEVVLFVLECLSGDDFVSDDEAADDADDDDEDYDEDDEHCD